jgi:hypothetical protein
MTWVSHQPWTNVRDAIGEGSTSARERGVARRASREIG